MATIEPYETAKGTRYRVRYRTPAHKQTSKRGFRTKKEASIFAASVEVAKAKGEFIESSLGKLTISEMGEKFMATKRISLKASSYPALEVSWRLRVKDRWGDTAIGGVKNEDVQDWIDELARKGYSRTSIMRDYGILLGVLDRAVRERKIPAHAARGVDLPGKAPKPRRYLTHSQVDALATASGDNSVIVLALAYTGMRWGEMAGLRVRHVDLARRRITVSENAVQVAWSVEVGTPKSNKERTIPIPAFLVDELKPALKNRLADALIFPDESGKHLKRPNSRNGWFARAVEAAQEADESFPRVTPHDLRHTAASLAVQAGAHVKAVQRMLGHASAAMTLDVYADLFDDDLDAVAEALDAARSRANVSKNGPTEQDH